MTNDNTKDIKRYSMCNSITNYYLLLMFTFFELFLTNQYAQARTDKFVLFIVLTGVLIIVTTLILVLEHLDKKSPNVNLSVEQPLLKLSVTDIAFLSFFICAVITTLISDYKLDSLTGSAGRDNGLILLFLYTAMYFIVSRFYYFKNYVLIAFLVFGCIISGLAILHFFYIDPMGIMIGYGENIIDDFGSTIGNKNTIASYMCIFLPFTMMMFIVQKNISVRILSAISIAFAYCGLLVAGSNSGYIGFFAMLFFMMLVCIRKPHLLHEFMHALSIMFASGLLLRLFSHIMNDKSKGFEQFGEILVYSDAIYIIIIVCIILTVLTMFIKDVDSINNHWPKKTLSIIVILIGVAAISVFAYYFYYYTVVDTETDIGSLSHILRFDDRWGTHRGFMWINGMKEYLDFDFMHILFGSGCDTFYHVFEPYFDELSRRFHNSSTNCIHNEYLNYLITHGLLGLSSYLAIIVTTVFRALKTSRENTLSLIFLFPIIAYCAQAAVNIYQPITTPFLFIFIALSESISRKSNSANKIQ